MEDVKPTGNVLRVYSAMLRDPTGQHYALELSKDAGVSVGTIYSVLARLEQARIVESEIETDPPRLLGRPARRYYTFSEAGLGKAKSDLRATQAALSIGGLSHV